MDKARKIPLKVCDVWSKVRAQLVSLVQIAKYQRYPELVMAVIAFETHISMSDIFTEIYPVIATILGILKNCFEP